MNCIIEKVVANSTMTNVIAASSVDAMSMGGPEKCKKGKRIAKKVQHSRKQNLKKYCDR